MHKISLRENVCTVRVCDALLSLLSLLIDFGILANRGRKESKKAAAATAAAEAKEAVEKAKAETEAKMGRKGSSGKATSPSGRKSIVPEEKEEKKEDKEAEEDNDGILSLHNTFMDVVVRILKTCGCPHGCVKEDPKKKDSEAAPPAATGMASLDPNGPSRSQPMPAPATGTGGGKKRCYHTPGNPSSESHRSRSISLLSRLLWYDKVQFKRFIGILVNTRDISFLLSFFHSYLGFCVEPNQLIYLQQQQQAQQQAGMGGSPTVPGKEKIVLWIFRSRKQFHFCPFWTDSLCFGGTFTCLH